jgi:hypothetical protein
MALNLAVNSRMAPKAEIVTITKIDRLHFMKTFKIVHNSALVAE